VNIIIRILKWIVGFILSFWRNDEHEVEIPDETYPHRLTPIHGLLYASGTPPSCQYDASAIPHCTRMSALAITLPSETIDENTIPKLFDIPSQEDQ
jgi:hypothetical protein